MRSSTVGAGADACALKHAPSIGRRDDTAQMQRAVVPGRIGRERHFATAAERTRHHAFRFHSRGGMFVMQRREPRGEFSAIRANLDAERALTRGGQTVFWIEQRADTLAQTQTLQTGGSQNDRGVVAAIEFRQTRIEIAAQRPHFEMRVTHAQHRFAAQARRADHGAGRQRGKRIVIVGRRARRADLRVP